MVVAGRVEVAEFFVGPRPEGGRTEMSGLLAESELWPREAGDSPRRVKVLSERHRVDTRHCTSR